eukprot:Hpha_TRINITY_DN15896_c1_g2::TRINITY_DN15896_c1_g2_i1::g.191887::m.191887
MASAGLPSPPLSRVEMKSNAASAPPRELAPVQPAPAAGSEVRPRGGRSGRRLRELSEALERERSLFEEVQAQVGALEGRRRDLEQRLQQQRVRPPPPRKMGPRPGNNNTPLQFMRPHAVQPYRAEPGRSSRRTAFSTNHHGGLVINVDRDCEWMRRQHLRANVEKDFEAEAEERQSRPTTGVMAAATVRGSSVVQIPLYRLPPAGMPSVTPVESYRGLSCRRSRFYGDYSGKRILVDLHDPPRISTVT